LESASIYPYIIGIIPNFYGFLNNMGISAPVGITRFSYFAYLVGLFYEWSSVLGYLQGRSAGYHVLDWLGGAEESHQA